MTKIYRTPEEKFTNLPGFSYIPNYLEEIKGFNEIKEGLRISYVDEGPKNSELTFLLVHGYLTWSYMWRHFIKVLTENNQRAVAIDLPGFGRSDKPIDESLYTFSNLRNSLINTIERLDLKNVVLVVHDWGGILGLTIPMEMEERFEGIILHNTVVTTGTQIMSESYVDWRKYCIDNPDLNVRAVIARTNRILNLKECNAYHAPFDNYDSKAALRALPKILPDSPDKEGADISRKASLWLNEKFDGTSVLLSGMRDPLYPQEVIKYLGNIVKETYILPGIDNAGHFLPEWAMEYGENLLDNFLKIRIKNKEKKKEREEKNNDKT